MESVEIVEEEDIIFARQLIRDLAAANGFSVMSKTRIATAVSELARNTFVHGGGGIMEAEVLGSNEKIGLRCVFTDQGPGFEDAKKVMEDGYSTASSLGQGLPGSRRLVDDFYIESSPGKGTRIEVVKWK